jgi:hypothetical protein
VRNTASTLSLALGSLLIIGGVGTWILVSTTLADQKITVSDDASCLAGDEVDGPFSAYCQAMVIDKHALEATGGLRYAELDQDDPKRQTAMTASFLQASLFTSVVAFGVAAMAMAIGVLFILIGLGIRDVANRIRDVAGRTRRPPEVGQSIRDRSGWWAGPGTASMAWASPIPRRSPDPPPTPRVRSARGPRWRWRAGGSSPNTVRSHSAMGYLTRPTTPRPGPPTTPNSHDGRTNNRVRSAALYHSRAISEGSITVPSGLSRSPSSDR